MRGVRGGGECGTTGWQGGGAAAHEKAMVDMVTSIGIQTIAHHGMKRW